MDNLGKKFEKKFKEDFSKIPNSSIDRIYDTLNGYSNITNISDYICYIKPYIAYLELKTHSGASIPLSNITQYDKLILKKGIPGVISGVILWLYEKDAVYFIPIEYIEYLKIIGQKSVGIRHSKDLVEIPSIKKRIFMDSDYRVIWEWKDSVENSNY